MTAAAMKNRAAVRSVMRHLPLNNFDRRRVYLAACEALEFIGWLGWITAVSIIVGLLAYGAADVAAAAVRAVLQ